MLWPVLDDYSSKHGLEASKVCPNLLIFSLTSKMACTNLSENLSIFLGGSDGEKQIPGNKRAWVFPNGLCGDVQESSSTGRCCYLRSGWSSRWSIGRKQYEHASMEGSGTRVDWRRSAFRRSCVFNSAGAETTTATATP